MDRVVGGRTQDEAGDVATESWRLPCGVVVELVAHEPDRGVAALSFWWQGTVWLASIHDPAGQG